VKLFYSRDELPEVTTLSVRTIEDEIRQGRFPKPRQLAGRRVGWLQSDLEEWATSRPPSNLPPPPNTGAKKPRGIAVRRE
jgi:prophage regulatory protein